MAITQGNVRFTFLNNRTQVFDLNTKVSDTMLVIYRELQEFDLYRWVGSVYVKYEDESGLGITVNGDVLSLHYGDSIVVDTIGATYAQSEAVAAYGEADWELELYRTSVYGNKTPKTMAQTWEVLLTLILVDPVAHVVSGLSADDHVRTEHYELRHYIKPYLGNGGVKGEAIDHTAHADVLNPGAVPEHRWIGSSLQFKQVDGTWGAAVDLSGVTGTNGAPPEHSWSGTYLRFKNPNGSWGSYVNLKGATGAGGGSLTYLKHRNTYAYASLYTSQYTQRSVTVAVSGYYLINAYMTCYAFKVIPWIEAALYDGSTLIAHGTSNIYSAGAQSWSTTSCSTIEYLSAGTTLSLKSKASVSGATRGLMDLSAIKVG